MEYRVIFNAIETDQRIKIKNEKDNININLISFFLYTSLAFIDFVYDARGVVGKRFHPPIIGTLIERASEIILLGSNFYKEENK